MAFDANRLTPEERELFEVLKENGVTPYEHAKKAMVAALAIDHQLVAAVEAKCGAEKAIEMHRKKWAMVAESAFKQAKEDLGIERVDDLDKLVRIRMYLNDGTPCPSKIKEEPGRATMTVLCCPLIQIAREVFGEGLDSTWLRAAAATEEWLYPEMIRLAGMEDRVVATADRFACLHEGDHVCRGVYEYLPGTGGAGGAVNDVVPKNETLGDPRDFTLDQVLDYCMAVTDAGPEEQCLRAVRSQYAGVYLTWKCLNEEFGPVEAEELYWECWKQLLKMSYDRASKDLGISRPLTARDVGRIHQAFFVDVPSRYNVVSQSDDEWVADVEWCPNPKLGPADVHSVRMAYYKTEYALSVRVNEYVIELAGLEDEVEHEHPTAACACADHKACRMIYRRKRG